MIIYMICVLLFVLLFVFIGLTMLAQAEINQTLKETAAIIKKRDEAMKRIDDLKNRVP